MPTFKVSWEMRAQDLKWTESLYRNAGGAEACVEPAVALGIKRLELSAAQGSLRCNKIRIARAAPLSDPYDLLVKAVELQNDKGPYSAETDTPDAPWTAQVCNFRDVNGFGRKFFLRGLPDAVTVVPWDNPITDAKWVLAFTGYLAQLVAGAWLIKGRTAHVFKDITALTVDAFGRLVVTSAAHGLVTGDKITFFRVQTHGDFVSGTKRVEKLTNDTFRVPRFNLGPLTFVSGKFYKPAFQFTPIVAADLLHKMRRKTGCGAHKAANRKKDQAFAP